MIFNANEIVRVRLTDHGRELLATNHALFRSRMGKPQPFTPPVEDADGWSRWQLWSLMQAFGPHIYLGCDMPFSADIEIPSDPPRDPSTKEGA